MHLRSLYLYNFRLFTEAKFEFGEGINLICGANGCGKTSILEAIHVLIAGCSFRTPHISDLIRQGEKGFFLEASFVKYGIEQKLKLHFDGKKKNILYNSTPLASPSNLFGLIQGVIFHPDDAALVKGAPQIRRQLLDLQIAQVDPLYIHHLTRYNRAMKQRNYLLRARQFATIQSWEYEMAHSAAYIVQQRIEAVNELEAKSRALHQQLGGHAEVLSLTYKGKVDAPLRDHFLDQFKSQRKREMELGMTLTGPHKDDLAILIENREARFFASEGQQRSCAAALRLAEWERLKLISADAPLMLIDDVGISFDNMRKARLLSHLNNLNQVFLTSTEPLTEINKKVISIDS